MLIKESPCLETYLLDKTDFHAAALKFKLRSNTLPLERKLSKWTTESDGICKLCHNGVEDVTHFLFLCNAYETIRIEEFQKLENHFIYDSCEDIWELFISSGLDIKLQLAIGGHCILRYFHDFNNNTKIHDTFDHFCKSYAKRAWKLRSDVLLN